MNLLRSQSTDQGTPGVLDFGGIVTLEKPWRDNQRGISCIPTGVYPISLYESERLGECLAIGNVQGRDDVRMHVGNWAGDVSMGFKSDSDGCVLVGLSTGVLDNQTAILDSHIAMQRLLAAFKTGLLGNTITILFDDNQNSEVA